MSKPPVLPINGIQDYFDKLIEDVSKYFKNQNIDLKFDGYKDMIRKYSELKFDEYEDCWELCKESNMWGEYYSELKALTEKLLLDAEAEKKKEFATVSTSEDAVKVANGDRLANKSPTLIALRKDRNTLQAFSTALESRIDFCYKCHHHCKSTCNWLQMQNTNMLTT